MKKLNSVFGMFMVMVMSLCLVACGGGGGGTAGGTSGGYTGGGTTPPPAAGTSKITKMLAVPAAGGAIKYTIGMPIALVTGSRANPFYKTSLDSFNAVQRFTGTSADGNYWLIDITVYDQNVSFIYGGDDTTTPMSWASIDLMGGGFFVANGTGGVATVGFNQSQIYNVATVPAPVTPPPGAAEPVVVTSKGQDPVTKMYRYKVTAALSTVTGSIADPAIVGDFTNWSRVRVPNVGGFINYSGVYSYNKTVKFTYLGDTTANTWASIDKSKYYVTADNSLVVGLQDGTAVLKSAFVPAVMGTTYVDPNGVVGFTLNPTGTSLIICFNLNKVSGVINAPFWSSNYTTWSRQPITIADASGMGTVTIPITQPVQLAFNFGGDLTALSYADMSTSALFFATLGTYRDVIGVDVKGNSITKLVQLGVL